MGPLPVVMYNGIPYQREQLDPDELETVTMQKILETTTFYQRAVYLVSQSNVQVTSSDCFFCSTNSLKPKDTSFIIINEKEAATANI